MDPWVIAVLLLIVGLGLAVLEIFFPSAGVLAVLSAVAMLAAIVFGFRQSNEAGFGILAGAVVGLPTIVVLGFRWWPRTALGRRMLLSAPQADEVLPDDPDRRELKTLVGRLGRTRCAMFPSGVITVDGRTVEATSEGLAIESGKTVRVIKVQANRVVVRPVDEELPQETAADPLQRPIDSILPDPFADPPPDSGPRA
jgi:membrane-bound ClpP family serine protease